MNFSELEVRRSYSESARTTSICSPTPSKTSKLTNFLAKEFLDTASSEENDFMNHSLLSMRLSKTRNSSVHGDAESNKSDLSNDSGSSIGTFDIISRSGARNPLFQEYIFEDVSEEIPGRSSNPIVNDEIFKTSEVDGSLPKNISEKSHFAHF